MTLPLADARAVAEQALAELGVPGCALWAAHGGQEDGFGLGVTSVAHPVPFTPDTLAQAGSITKTVTATAAARLAQRGLLDLDAPVRSVLPGFRLADEGVAAVVTTRALLQHTGGFLGDWFDDLGWGDDALARFVDGFETLPQLAPPGALWSYCNTGFCAAGRALEVAAGQPYEQLVRELVLDDALFFPWEVITRGPAVGHHVQDGGGAVVAEPWAVSRTAAPAGGLVASVRTLVRYGRAHLEDATLASMRAPDVPVQDGQAMGLAWFVKEWDGVQLVEHGGTTNGQCAQLVLVPDRGVVVAAVANHQHGHALLRRVVGAALHALAGVEQPELEPVTTAPGVLEEAAGRYEAALTDVEVARDDNGLVVTLVAKGGFPRPDSPPMPAPPPARAAFHAPDAFHVVDGVMAGSRGQLLRGPDGAIEWLRFGLRVHRRTQSGPGAGGLTPQGTDPQGCPGTLPE